MDEGEVSTAMLEPTTLQWPGDRGERKEKEGESRGAVAEKEHTVGGREGEVEEGKGSIESVCSSQRGRESRTESARESRTEEGWAGAETEKARESGTRDALLIGLEEDDGMNWMPEKAARVFSPNVMILHPSCKHDTPGEGVSPRLRGTEKSPLLGPQGTPPDAYYPDWSGETELPKTGACSSGDRETLKVGAFVLVAALIFPFLVWGGYEFLPFNAPLLKTAPLRLVYTLRCSIFAVVPIVLGVLVLGVSRIRFRSVRPLYEGNMESREVGVHQHYINDSVSLFLLYFLQLAVMASYLSQELLKLVPLLTIVFAFGRLVYWVSAALGSSVRGVGFGLSFLPILAMMGANLYFIFTLDGGGGIIALAPPPTPAPPRMRFWG